MDAEKLKFLIGRNIAAHRKRAGLTQAGLAEKLNYSDKAVSKWERGESIPDVLTLAQLADRFGITVNDLLSDPNALPAETGAVLAAVALLLHEEEQLVECPLRISVLLFEVGKRLEQANGCGHVVASFR